MAQADADAMSIEAQLFLEYASQGKYRSQADADAKLTSAQFLRLCQDAGIGGKRRCPSPTVMSDA